MCFCCLFFFFFFNDTATTEIYTLSLHDALPISHLARHGRAAHHLQHVDRDGRSEEHTSELQSRPHLVCRLLLEKKKKPLKNFYTKQETRQTKRPQRKMS